MLADRLTADAPPAAAAISVTAMPSLVRLVCGKYLVKLTPVGSYPLPATAFLQFTQTVANPEGFWQPAWATPPLTQPEL